tara:strand:+ start:1165 stop:1383 length:219 start_codon:yes stop_codon:yes gene_type:complete
MSQLEFIPSDKLILELKKRFDDFVFVGSQKRTGTVDDYVISFKGTYHGILGLCEMARMASETGSDKDELNTN